MASKSTTQPTYLREGAQRRGDRADSRAPELKGVTALQKTRQVDSLALKQSAATVADELRQSLLGIPDLLVPALVLRQSVRMVRLIRLLSEEEVVLQMEAALGALRARVVNPGVVKHDSTLCRQIKLLRVYARNEGDSLYRDGCDALRIALQITRNVFLDRRSEADYFGKWVATFYETLQESLRRYASLKDLGPTRHMFPDLVTLALFRWAIEDAERLAKEAVPVARLASGDWFSDKDVWDPEGGPEALRCLADADVDQEVRSNRLKDFTRSNVKDIAYHPRFLAQRREFDSMVPELMAELRVGKILPSAEPATTPRASASELILRLANLKVDIVTSPGPTPTHRERLDRELRLIGKINVNLDVRWKRAVASSFNEVLKVANWHLRVFDRGGGQNVGYFTVVPGSNPAKGCFQLRHAKGTAGNVLHSEIVDNRGSQQSPSDTPETTALRLS